MNVSDIDDIAGRFNISNDEAERIASTVKSEAEFISTWESTDWWTDAKAEKENAGLGIAGINVRFFCQVWDDMNGGADVAEIDESTFVSLGGRITYDHMTISVCGCRQICLTTDSTLDE